MSITPDDVLVALYVVGAGVLAGVSVGLLQVALFLGSSDDKES